MKTTIVVLSALLLLVIGPHVSPVNWHTTPYKWKEPRIFHEPFDEDYEHRIEISHIKSDEKIKEDRKNEIVYSPNKAYWYTVYLPDTMKSGPWSTEIKIFNERDYVIDIKLIDHAATYMTTIKWINQKLLYIEFWWGRVRGSYVIFDVETEKIIVKEMVCDGGLAFQQWHENRNQ